VEHVRLVHRGHLLAAAARPLERNARYALALTGRHLAHRYRHVLGRHELPASHEHVAVGIEALGAFAENHEAYGFPGQSHAHARLWRADIGEEIELYPQLARWIDPALFARRILEVIDGSKDDARGAARGLHHCVGQGRALLLERYEADLPHVPFEPE